MKVIVNFPEQEADIKELENRIADFRATLFIEKIKKINISDISKKKLLNLAIEYFKEKSD